MGKNTSQSVHVRVIKHLPLGLLVELDNGEEGIIRVREISWDQDKRLNWKQLYPADSEAWAVPINIRAGHPNELSLRLVENDPWTSISNQVVKDKAYVGVVTGLMTYGAFIELAPGVTGLLHETKLPAWMQKRPPELFWPGDRVKVVVEHADAKRRRLGLALPVQKFTAAPPSQFSSDSSDSRKQAEIDTLIKDKSNKKRILVVEDDPDQGKLVASWLRHIGQDVEVVSEGEQALACLENVSADIVLIDVGLPGMDGIALANQLLETYPGTQLVVTTEFTSADKWSSELNSLQEKGVDFLAKPLNPDDLVDFLKKNGKHPEKPPIQEKVTVPGSLLEAKPGPSRSIRPLLQKSRVRLGFEAAILFRLDPVRRTVSIVESSSQLTLNTYAIPALIYSPVREIAVEEEIIVREQLTKEEQARFQHLLDLFPVQACIGVPVPVNLPDKYALLFLDSEPQELYDEDQLYTEAVALAAGTYLEQNLLREKTTVIQRYALIGQLTSALVHEVNNLMGPLNNRLDLFKDRLEKLTGNQVDSENSDFLKKNLESIQQASHKILSTTRMLGRVIAKDKNEMLRLDEIARETINLMEDTADRSHVDLMLTPPEKLLLIHSQSAALQQILLNLLLNAIQQTSEFRPGHGGTVQVSFELVSTTTPNSAVRILVKDNGPGIHASLWETIFELGYSTRKDGSGIGLYISKSLAEDKLKGSLFVQESYILGGTVIALEIPLRV